jgi:tetratricopeptide (TPR) repeat protein
MTPDQFEALLNQADQFAQAENWQAAFTSLSQANLIKPDHPGVVNGMGMCLIQMQRTADALPYFYKLVELAPDSSEAHNNLGVVLAFTGRLNDAEEAYHKALNLNQEHFSAWKNLAQLYLQQADRISDGVNILQTLIQNNPQDAEALFLMGNCYELGEDLESAKTLYHQALKYKPDYKEAREALARVAPVNSDSAHIARPEHAQKLAGLKSLTSKMPNTVKPSANGSDDVVKKNSDYKPAVAFYGSGAFLEALLLSIPAKALARAGYKVKLAHSCTNGDLSEYDLFVFSQPHISKEIMEALTKCNQIGKKTALYLDDDYFEMPTTHPNYTKLGPGNPAAMKALENAISMANMLVTTNQSLAQKYVANHKIKVIPPAWDPSNPLWQKKAPKHDALHLGIISHHIVAKDASMITPCIKRVLRENSQTLLAIGGETTVYGSLSDLPDDRTLFIPIPGFDDYPYLLAQIDILLLPHKNTPYNQNRSDLPLMEAGIRRIPWVASPTSAYKEWGVGGLLVDKPEDWYEAITRLIKDSQLREELGQAGYDAAMKREINQQLTQWQSLLTSLMAN